MEILALLGVESPGMDRQSRIVGGVAGIGVGVFVLTFAVSNDLIGGLFSREALQGQSIDPWLERIAAHPVLAQVAIACPILGFTLMLVVARVVASALPESGLRTVATSGYLVGVPLAVVNFTAVLGLVRNILLLGANDGGIPGDLQPDIRAGIPEAAKLLIGIDLSGFMLANIVVGPLLIGLVGNAMLCLAGLRSKVMPTWLCAWGIGAAALLLVASFEAVWPPLSVASIGGPFTMLWFVFVGIAILRGKIQNAT